MGSVWKRLQRVNKRAAKFQFTVSYHQLVLEFSPKWQPHKLAVVWCRRSRRVASTPMNWEPTLQNPYRGIVVWPVPENHQVSITLFKDLRTNELEDKDWSFVIEDVATAGKRRQLGIAHVNMRKYASVESSQSELQVNFRPLTKKISMGKLDCTISCVFLREGKATDEDMQSMASLMSVNNTIDDIAPLDDVDDDDFGNNDSSMKTSIHEVTQHLHNLAKNLSGSDVASSTPIRGNNGPTSCDNVKAPIFSDKSHSPRTKPKIIVTTPILPKFDEFPEDENDPYSVRCTEMLDKLGLNDDENSDESIRKSLLKDSEWRKTKKDKPTTISIVEPIQHNVQLESVVEEKDDVVVTDTSKSDRAKSTTPGQDLLEWCKEMTHDYPGVKVTNLTTSWRNGMAFGALIHHFEPTLLDFNGLCPHDVKGNCKIAFDAGDKLGIPRVIEPTDMHMLAVPDKLAVMTYLHQLRAHFTGHQLEVQQIGKTAAESNYVVGKFNTDNNTDITKQIFGQEISNLRKSKQQQQLSRSQEQNKEKQLNQINREITEQKSKANLYLDLKNRNEPAVVVSMEQKDVNSKSPTSVKDVKEMILTNSKNFVNKMISPQLRDKKIMLDNNNRKNDSKKCALMTRRELNDPFGSDEEDESTSPNGSNNNNNNNTINLSNNNHKDVYETTQNGDDHKNTDGSSITNENDKDPFADLPKPNPQILLRHSEQRERARQLLEQSKKDKTNPSSPTVSEDERHSQLRERARRLMAEVRRTSTPTNEVIRISPIAEPTRSFCDSSQVHSNEFNGNNHHQKQKQHSEQNGDIIIATNGESEQFVEINTEKSSSLSNSKEHRITPDKLPEQLGLKEMGIDVHNWIDKELEDLEREQSAIDKQAATLEKQLRLVMEASTNNVEEEEALMAKWFMFVNKKNALLRRQMQLNILEKEADLETRYKVLNEELQQIASVEDWQKSEEQRNREQMLLDELVQIVNKRDELVHHLDNQEKAIEDDDLIEKDLSHLELQPKDKCVIQ